VRGDEMTTLGEILQKHIGSIDRVTVQYSPDRSSGESLLIAFQNPKVSVTEGLAWVTIDDNHFPYNIELQSEHDAVQVIFYLFDYHGVKIDVSVRKAELVGDLVIERRPNGNILLRRSEGMTWFVLSQEELEHVK